MDKKILTSVLAMAAAASAAAMPAHPDPATVTQPDGSQLTLLLHGDEFNHYTTTSDGYTVRRAADGSYVYDMPGMAGTAAHDPASRSNAETAMLLAASKHTAPALTPVQKQMLADRRYPLYGLQRAANYDYNNFHGLVLLVEYSDRQFADADPHTLFGDMVTAQGYTGFTRNGSHTAYTGSVRDYFYDNSMGQFDAQFDVVGPVQISKSQYYVNGTDNIRDVIREALTIANPQVDYSIYDGDGDGTVDMFYVIFAGGGSNFSGNDERLVWPHAWTMSGDLFDGVKMGRYACSTELFGPPSWNMIDGIGTVCHEFSHVLGLMDEYDTDYGGSGGLSPHPGEWSLMASGGYLNYSRTPCGYTLMQRGQSGFTVPETITAPGTYTLEDIDTSNHGYKITTPDSREYFLLENRRKTKWNEYSHGTGMLVHRVDSTNTGAWTYNNINADPGHPYYLMLRAHTIPGNGVNASVGDHDGDPFPGSYGVTEITYATDPAMKAWSGLGADYILRDITENADGTVSFTAAAQATTDLCEGFENVTTDGKYNQQVPGEFCNWSFSNAMVDGSSEGYRVGERAAGIYKGGYLESSPIEGETSSVTLTVFNPTSRPITYNVRYHLEGNNWEYLYEPGGVAGIPVGKNESHKSRFDIPEEARTNLRFQLKLANNTGSTSEAVYVDDIHVMQDGGDTAVEDLQDTACPNCCKRLYNLQGIEIASPLPGQPVIERRGNKTAKFISK